MKIFIFLAILIAFSSCDPSINGKNEQLWNTLLTANSTTNLTDLQTLDISSIAILGQEQTPKSANFTLATMQYFGTMKRNAVLGKMYFYGKEKLIGFKSSNVQPIQQKIAVKDFFYRLWAARYYMYSTTLNWKSATTSSSSQTIDQTIIDLNTLNDMASSQNYYSFNSNFTVTNINATATAPALLCAQLNFIELPTHNTMTYSFCTETVTFPLQQVLNIIYGNSENNNIKSNNNEDQEHGYLHRLTRKDGDEKKIYL